VTKVIKRGPGDTGDISPDAGFTDGPLVRHASIIRSDVAEAKSEAQAIRERAESEAAEIRRQALAEAEQVKKRAHDEGYKAGRDQGVAELAEIVAHASQRLEQIEAQAVPQLRDLALTIARKILGRELEFHPEAVVDVVKQALAEKARQRREIVLRVNPEDLATIREHRAELLEVLSRAKEIGVREDPDVARSGVIIETDAGIIDAQLETQLGVFERVLKEAR
jgi:type III secretion protein L